MIISLFHSLALKASQQGQSEVGTMVIILAKLTETSFSSLLSLTPKLPRRTALCHFFNPVSSDIELLDS